MEIYIFIELNHGVSGTSPLHMKKNHYQGYEPKFLKKNYCTQLENNI